MQAILDASAKSKVCLQCTIMLGMFTPTKMIYTLGAAVCGSAAGGYVAWAIYSRFARIAELNDRAIVEPHVLVVLCVAGGLLAFPLGAAAGLIVVTLAMRFSDFLRGASRRTGKSDTQSWVGQRASGDESVRE